MGEIKHTPGPWRWTKGYDPEDIDISTYEAPGYYDNAELMGADDQSVLGCGEYDIIHGASVEQRIANAHLIAAAPEMKEALGALISVMETTECDRPFRADYAKAKAALAKANGEAGQ